MKKYIEELKLVSWPKGKEVNQQFWITIFGIIFLVLFFIGTDLLITKFLELVY